MSAFQDRFVTFIGRLELLPLHRARRLVTAAGGVLRRDLSRTSDLGVVGHRVAFDVERWRSHVDRAKRSGAQLISENTFLRLLGSCSSADLGDQALNTRDIQARSGLSAENVEILVLFDIVEPVDGAFPFRDLILARSIAHLLSQGVAIADVVRDLVGRRRCFDLMPASLVEDDDGRIVIGIGAKRFELDGQLRLPLSGGESPSAEALFDAAEAAEACGDHGEAERLYRCCLDRDRGDWLAAFNLANALQHLGREREILPLARARGRLPSRFCGCVVQSWRDGGSIRQPGRSGAIL